MKVQFLRQRFFLSILPAGYAFLVLCLVRLFFFVINFHSLPAGNNLVQWWWIIGYGCRFDLITSLGIWLLLTFLGTIYSWWPQRGLAQLIGWLYISIILIVASLSLVDAVYFNGNHRRMARDDLFFIPENAGLVLPYLRKFWWLPVVPVLACLGARWVALRWISKKLEPVSTGQKLVTGLIFSLLFFLLVFDGRTSGFFTPSSGYFVMKSENVPFSSNTPAELLVSGNYSRLDINAWTFMNEQQAFAIHPVLQQVGGRSSTKKNIVLFIIESASGEDFQQGARRKQMMPFLDSLMGHSLVFDNFFANAVSSPSGFDAIIGGMPEGYAADFFMTGYGYNKTQWFTELLKEQGYRTHFFYGVKGVGYSFLKTSKSYQLDHNFGYGDYALRRKGFDGYYGIYDHVFFPVVADEMNKLKVPFLSVIYNVSTHAPYNLIPAAILDTLPSFKKSNGRSLRYYDDVIRDFFSRIRNQPWFRGSVFVFVADHFSRAPDAEGKSSVDIYKIPMFIYTPDSSYKGHCDAVGQQIDLPATLLDMVGPRRTFFSYGRSLFGSSGERIAFNKNGAVLQAINAQYVLQYNFITKKVQGYYQYKNDPLLVTNLYYTRQAEADRLLKHLQAFWEVYALTLHGNKMHPDSFK
ncbi:MAG: sulfatase-like hydrolase/transferase [Bacteroidota bacterium]